MSAHIKAMSAEKAADYDLDAVCTAKAYKVIDEVLSLTKRLELDKKNLERENASLVQWVHDLQAGMSINCVYCGKKYGPDDEVPSTMADVLKEHVEQCPKHPMSALRREGDELRAQIRVLRPDPTVRWRPDMTGKAYAYLCEVEDELKRVKKQRDHLQHEGDTLVDGTRNMSERIQKLIEERDELREQHSAAVVNWSHERDDLREGLQLTIAELQRLDDEGACTLDENGLCLTCEAVALTESLIDEKGASE